MMETPGLNEEQMQELAGLAAAWNDRLLVAGSSNAERAFGLGCGIGLLPLLVVIVILFVLKMINLILAIMLLFIGILALIGFASLVAYQARVNNMKRVYREQVEPEIVQFMSRTRTSRSEIAALVSGMLLERAPLLEMISSSLEDDAVQEP